MPGKSSYKVTRLFMSTSKQALFKHQDILNELNYTTPLAQKLSVVHAVLKGEFSFIDRIAVAIYDHKTDLLKTYIHSTPNEKEPPLSHYQAKLGESTSLMEIVRHKRPRVVNNLALFASGRHEHTQRIRSFGYASSYTMPMYHNDAFYGFVFFNSYTKDGFSEAQLPRLDVFGHLISLLIINDQNSIHTLLSSVKVAQSITHFRDIETGNHLERMSRYARLIAVQLADHYDLDDEYIEHLYMFAALHDIGKIAIPDSILHKPGKLNAEERQVMNTHPSKGREIIDSILDNYGLKAFDHTDLLRNIAQFHHEAVNGRGYPAGLHGDDIPLEARIIAVADVFDALVSKRPYKEAWSNGKAISVLQEMASARLDAECVEALISNLDEVQRIQEQFADVTEQ